MIVFISIAATILLLYFLISHFVFKRKLKIKEKKLGTFSKNRNKVYVIAEILSINAFIIMSIVYLFFTDSGHFSPNVIPQLIAILFFTLQVIRGLELRTFHREDKSYYYQSLGAAMFVALFLVFHFSEGYRI